MPRSTASSTSPTKERKPTSSQGSTSSNRRAASSSAKSTLRRPSSSARPLVLDSDDDDDDDDDKDAVMDERSDGQGSGESDDESEPEYEVEEIRDHQFVKSSGKYKFLVKWLGYPSSENTWEPEENITAPALVDAYWAKQPRSTQKEKRAEYLEKEKGNKLRGGARNGRSASTSNDRQPKLSSSHYTRAPTTTVVKPTKVKSSLRDSSEEDEKEVEGDVQQLDDTDSDWERKEQEWKAKYDNMESWEKVVKKVSTLDKTPEGELLAYLDFKNGATLIYPTTIANKKCPQKLLQFYEQNLKFTDPKRDLSALSKSGFSKRR